jgi:hypothetical protein
MKIITNDKLISRNKKISQITMIGSFLVIAAAMYLLFQQNLQLVSLAFVATLLGYLLTQVSVYYGSRYNRRPRPDEQLNNSLKGLDDKYTLYHYSAPVSHLLTGPSGIWILIPYQQSGTIVYEKNRWKQKGGNLYLKIFGQENIGRPDMDIVNNQEDLVKFMKKKLPEEEWLPFQVALVFTNEKIKIDIEGAPVPTIPAGKLKELIRKKVKEFAIPLEKLDQLNQLISS